MFLTKASDFVSFFSRSLAIGILELGTGREGGRTEVTVFSSFK